jgi:hypothetical protein
LIIVRRTKAVLTTIGIESDDAAEIAEKIGHPRHWPS